MPYHEAIREFLKSEEAEVWNWYASNKVREDQAEAVKFDLLKATYRIERESQPEAYQAAEDVAERLSLDIPITIYQAQNPQGLNASLAFLPDEGHIVLHGPVIQRLSNPELRALFGHELSHLLLWQGWGGEFLIVDQILAALTYDDRAQMPHYASARLFGLYNEIFCDRGSLVVADDPHIVVSMLVKVFTDLDSVDPASYIRQAEEIFAKQTTRSDALSHPEAFIRAQAINLWHGGEEGIDETIAAMIEGPLILDELDLIAQRRVAGLTRRLIEALLQPAWLRSDSVLSHARMYFDDFELADSITQDDSLADDLRTADKPLRNYYCYVLLDFVTADRDLEEAPLAAALVLAEQLGLKEPFAEIARKELRLRKKQFDKIDKEKQGLLDRAAKEFAKEAKIQ